MRHVTFWLGGAMLVLAVMYYLFVHRQMKAKVQGTESGR